MSTVFPLICCLIAECRSDIVLPVSMRHRKFLPPIIRINLLSDVRRRGKVTESGCFIGSCLPFFRFPDSFPHDQAAFVAP